MPDKKFTVDEAIKYGKEIGIDWTNSKFDPEEFRKGMDIELEHGTKNPETNLTNDDPVMTAKITLAHLREVPDYNTRLLAMEDEAKKVKAKKANPDEASAEHAFIQWAYQYGLPLKEIRRVVNCLKADAKVSMKDIVKSYLNLFGKERQ